MKEKTGMILAHAGEEYDQYFNAIVPPIFMNSLNIFPTVDEYYDSDKRDKHTYCYGRVQNQTVRILEEKITELEKGTESYVFSSGMAAATAAVLTTCSCGGHVEQDLLKHLKGQFKADSQRSFWTVRKIHF